MFHPAKLDRLTIDFKITQAGSIFGAEENDGLTGSVGADILDGGKGHDWLDGGPAPT
jgi:Ca2+-binding RTX toxin-like protein